MSNQAPRRHLAGWITAAAAATAVFTVGGAAATFATVYDVASALSASSANHGSNEQAGYNPYGGSSGSGQIPGQSGSGSSGSTGTAATASQEKGVAIIDTVLQYDGAEAAGTGIVLTSNGEILTNNHVVEGSTSIKVTVASGRTYTAKVVGTDATDDVAVLQLSGASGLATASIGSDANVSVGDDVVAVGNAGGTSSLTAASGEVTGTDKSITTQAEESVASETLSGLIETNADIEAGDSGGPLYNASGHVIGIDTAASGDTTVTDGYAIPIDNALTIAHQIESGVSSADVTIGLPAFLGVEVAADGSQDGSAEYGYGYSSGGAGAQIAQVIGGTAAASAGIEAGDTITAVNGAAVSSSDDLTTALSQLKPGASATITFTDVSGVAHTATVTLGSGPAA